MKESVFSFLQKFFFIVLLFYCQNGTAINELFFVDTRSFSLGNVHALSNEVLNPASISFSKQKQAGISIMNRFGMKELNSANIYLKYPNQWVGVGLKLSTFGYEDYRIIQSQASLAKKLTNKFSLGVQLAYINESSILEDSSNHFITSGVSIYYVMNEQIALTILGENILHSFKQNLLTVYGGMKYEPIENTTILLEASYGKEALFNFSIGFEYEIFDQLTLSTGFRTNPKMPSLGLAYKWNQWRVETGFSLHPQLGISSMVGINFEFK
jgi:hypothetical protein